MLCLIDASRYPDPLDDWPLPLAVPFIESRELAWLKQDLESYARGRVRGRSYLIAGHRGAGKTALVQHAVDLLAATVMSESVKENADLPVGPFQRPLLVKLHGPSMLEEMRPADAAGDAAAGAANPNGKPAAADAATPKVKAAGEENAATAATGEPAAGVSVTPGAHAALVQVTIGLYRALATEAATGFRAHARWATRKRASDQAELAAQLALDLDSGASAGRLRGYWSALGRLTSGVIWPVSAGPALAAHGMADQGLREIIALATAAQAFQVCTGRTSYAESSKDHLVRKELAKLKGESDIKQALTQLGTLGLGALTGVSLLGVAGGTGVVGTPGALIGGLAVWLLGSLGLRWSHSRTRTNDRSVDYSFIRDSTLATLGRDLPVVINRVREAGLAPVFVVDELDKVDDAPNALAGLIAKLKHIVADFGFFCFLVNRDCYEEIEARIRATAYPTEHTLFSDRLLLRPDPDSMLRYLADLVGFETTDVQAGLARATFGLVAIHEARLNLTELMRVLAHAARPGTRELGDSGALTSQRRLVQATVQLAIGEVLRSPALLGRMEASPAFAQLAIDALYYPSRLRDDGIRDIDPSHEKLRVYLAERRRASTGHQVQGDGREGAVSHSDLDILQEHLVQLLTSLCDIDLLRLALGDRNASKATGEPKPGDVRLADVPPRDVKAICERLQDGRFRFLFTRDGDAFKTNPGRLDPDRRNEIEAALGYARAFHSLVDGLGLNLDQLARTPLIASVASDSFARAVAAVELALRVGIDNPDVQQHFSTIERLRGEVVANAEKLGELFLIAASLSRDVDQQAPVLPAIIRLIRFDREPRRWIRGLQQRPVHALPDDLDGLENWTQDHVSWLLPAPGSVTLNASPDFPWLAERLRAAFADPRGDSVIEPDYALLLQAVRGELPATALAWNLTTLTAGDWSRLALSAVPTRDSPASAPYWLFIAALRGLGFGHTALEELSAPETAEDLKATPFGWRFEVEGMTSSDCLAIARGFAGGAEDRPPGLLVIEHEGERFGSDPPSQKRPVLIVDARDVADYRPVLNWLLANGILAGRSIGPGDDTESG